MKMFKNVSNMFAAMIVSLCFVVLPAAAQAGTWSAPQQLSFSMMGSPQVASYVASNGATATAPTSGSCTSGQVFKFHTVQMIPRPPSNLVFAGVTIYQQICS